MMTTATKTDSLDAKPIALYSEKMNPPAYKMPSEAIIILKAEKGRYQTIKEATDLSEQPAGVVRSSAPGRQTISGGGE